MLEKNKDYVEFTLQYTSVDWARSKDCPEVYLKGYSDFSFLGVPIMDVVCNELDHKVVVVSKRDFDRLQADDQHYRELAKQREENYKALLDKTGFYNLADLMCYLPKDKTLKDIIDGLAAENEGLIKKLQESDPFAEKKELLEKLYSTDDVEKLEWAINHICGGQASANGWMVTAKLWRRNYESLSKLVGFSSTEEIQDYLTNEAECDTLQEAVSKLKDQVKYTCDKWYSANSSNNSWKAAAECNSPHELIEKLNLLRDDISGRSTVIESYKRDIEKWQKATGYSTPEEVKEFIEGLREEIGIYSRALNEWKEGTGCPGPSAAKILKEKLTEEIEAWKNATGFSTPDEYVGGWQKIRCLCEGIYKSNGDYDNLLKLTGYKSEDDIRVLLRYGERQLYYSTMRDLINALKRNAKFSEATWKDATGCSKPGEARILLEKWKVLTKCETPEAAATWITSYEKACERGNELAEKVEEWKKATGFNTPEEASKKLKYYENRLDSAKESASYAIRHLDNIVFRDDKRTDWSDK